MKQLLMAGLLSIGLTGAVSMFDLMRRWLTRGGPLGAAAASGGGMDDHLTGHVQGAQFRKLAIIRNPVVCDFSGWNCMPSIVSRPITAVTSPA